MTRALVFALRTAIVACATCASLPAAAQQKIVLAVSEGTSGGQDPLFVRERFQPLANLIGRTLKASVEIRVIRDFERLEAGARTQAFDLLVARPSDYPARALRDYAYRFVATAKPEGQCVFIGPRDRKPFASLTEARGLRISLPEEVSYMAKLCRYALAQAGIEPANSQVRFQREQGAVAYIVENGFADVGGVASYSGVARDWSKKGTVLWRSAPQPFLPMVASRNVSSAQIRQLQEQLLALRASDDEGVLRALQIDAFDASTEPRLRELADKLSPK